MNIILMLGCGLAFLLLIATSIIGVGMRQDLDQQRAMQATSTNQTTTGGTYPAYMPGNGTLFFSDSLQEPDYWQSSENPNFGGSCQFIGGALHSRQEKAKHSYGCFSIFSSFANFALEVQMTIIQGDCGVVTFRQNNGKFYYVHICQDGTYKFLKYQDFTGKNVFIFVGSRPHEAIKSGLNQMNLLAIYANGNMLRVFVNKQQIAMAQDGEIAQGGISLAAEDHTQPTEVVFQQAKVWTLQ
jgi:hypothetical protein